MVNGEKPVAEVADQVRLPFSFGRFLRARLSPGALGLSLTIGFLVAFGFGWVFADLLDGVLEGDGLAGIDKPVTNFVVAHRTHTLTLIFTAFTDLGGVAVLAPLTGVAAALLAWRTRSWRPILVAALAVGGIQALVFSLKYLVGRPRPAAALAVQPALGFSFPSGHSTSSLVAFGALAWLATAVVKRSGGRVALWACAVILFVGVGASRIYLGVHYLTDVLGGWALGTAWLSVILVSFGLAAGLRPRPPVREYP
jgi:membrane-associated phospholipid phosphatase